MARSTLGSDSPMAVKRYSGDPDKTEFYEKAEKPIPKYKPRQVKPLKKVQEQK